MCSPWAQRSSPDVRRTSGKKICIRTHRLCPDAPGARDALDALWQGTYRTQCETHRQCEFGRSSPWHHAFGGRMPGRRASGHSSPCHLLTGRSVSGHFPSGRSRVRAFSFWAQPCQGKWRPDNACHGTTVTLSVKVRNIVANTLVAYCYTWISNGWRERPLGERNPWRGEQNAEETLLRSYPLGS